MKTQYKSGNFVVEFEFETQTGLVEQIAAFEEVFANTKCGKCGSENVKWVVRTDKEDNKYYELRCQDCGAKLAFGCNKKGGGLFPKKKDAEGNWKPDNGWMKWNKDTQQEE